jgi:uncharacterized membrane protein YgcG
MIGKGLHMRTFIAALATASLTLIIASAAQATPTPVNLRIEGKSETLFEGPILTEGHDVEASSDTQERPCNATNNDAHATPGATPTASAVEAMRIIGETFDGRWYPGYDDYFITRWGADEQDPLEGAYWGVLVNDVLTNVGGCQYELHEDDEVLWVYDAFKERASLALFPARDTAARPPLTAIAQLDQPFGVQVEAYGDGNEDNPPGEPERADATPYGGAQVAPVLTSHGGFEQVQTTSPEAVTTNSEGKASITFTTPGWHRIKAGTPLNDEGEEQAIRSNRVDVCVPAHGETGCGPLPAEDDPRISPAWAGTPGEEHHETLAETPGVGNQPDGQSGGGNQSGGQSGGGSQSGGRSGGGNQSGSGSGAARASGSTLRPVRRGSGPTALLTLESITSRRLLLRLTAPGAITVQIAHKAGGWRHPGRRVVKTMTVKATKAGQIEVKLPELTAGRYRLRIGLAGANSVRTTLTITRRRG